MLGSVFVMEKTQEEEGLCRLESSCGLLREGAFQMICSPAPHSRELEFDLIHSCTYKNNHFLKEGSSKS